MAGIKPHHAIIDLGDNFAGAEPSFIGFELEGDDSIWGNFFWETLQPQSFQRMLQDIIDSNSIDGSQHVTGQLAVQQSNLTKVRIKLSIIAKRPGSRR